MSVNEFLWHWCILTYKESSCVFPSSYCFHSHDDAHALLCQRAICLFSAMLWGRWEDWYCKTGNRGKQQSWLKGNEISKTHSHIICVSIQGPYPLEAAFEDRLRHSGTTTLSHFESSFKYGQKKHPFIQRKLSPPWVDPSSLHQPIPGSVVSHLYSLKWYTC